MQTNTRVFVTFSLGLIVGLLTACTSKPAAHASNASPTTTAAQPSRADDLQSAMDKLRGVHSQTVYNVSCKLQEKRFGWFPI